MTQIVQVHLLPALTSAEELAQSMVIVIDVLRASTTIVYALAGGATAVVPCSEVDEARQQANQLGDVAVLGGERGGRPIEGFDLGNSPSEYTSQAVAGKTIFFTTTNGTRAIKQCLQADRVIIGAFTNFSAVCEAVLKSPRVDLLCAGTRAEISREDALLAGAIVDRLQLRRTVGFGLNDQAYMAVDAWRQVAGDLFRSGHLAGKLRASRGGQNLLEIAMEQDIEIAAAIDRFDLVPELDMEKWEIRMP